jgi:hypothetical protein
MSKFLYISRFCCIYEERTFHELDILPSSSSSSRPLYTHTGTLALVRRPRPRYHIDILCITVPREREIEERWNGGRIFRHLIFLSFLFLLSACANDCEPTGSLFLG